jgi:2-oxoglutarate ferredoxin oxidoreductase subunit alpha
MLGLAIAAELPLVVVNAQRGGPSTGLPTKTEQSDLFQATLGRNADAPLPVVAASSPGDAFDCAIEAIRISVTHMTPVILLTDGYLANAAEPWRVPEVAALPVIPLADPAGRSPYQHDPTTLARPWIPAGTKGGRHRIGGLERADGSGAVSYDPKNHQRMTELRQERVRRIADFLPPTVLEAGEIGDELLLVGWGSTKGAIAQATAELRAEGVRAAHLHLRHLAPFANDLGPLLARFPKVLVCEMNMGQLAFLMQGHFGHPVASLTKVSGRPFQVREIKERARRELAQLGAVA